MKLENILEGFKDINVLVIGDAVLDTYLTGTTERLCREAPVPIVDIKRVHQMPGGAGNTAVNLSKLGANVNFLSVIGFDKEGKDLISSFNSLGVNALNILKEERNTLVKQRIIADSQMIVRFDQGTTSPIKEETEDKLIDKMIDLFIESDAVIVSDYGYGILTEKVIKTLSALQKKSKKVLVVDSKYLGKYKNMDITAIKPNYNEVTAILGLNDKRDYDSRISQVTAFKEEILKITNSKIAAVTLDIDGALIIEKDYVYRTYTRAVRNIKAAGAGDTFTAAFALGLASEATVSQSAEIASMASFIAVRKDETAFCTLDELTSLMLGNEKFVTSINKFKIILSEYIKQGKKIVFTNGCFDILHKGHVQYLNNAKSLGDILIVAINSDVSVKKIKGETRPINPLEDRVSVLSGLSSVDHIIPFDENTPINLIKIAKPNVYVKGGDYQKVDLPEAPIVENYGGRVEILPYLKGHSTTNIIEKIKEKSLRRSDGNYGKLYSTIKK